MRMVRVLGLISGQRQAQFIDREMDPLGARCFAKRPAVERQRPVHSVDDDAARPRSRIAEPVLRHEGGEPGAEIRVGEAEFQHPLPLGAVGVDQDRASAGCSCQCGS